MITIAYAIFEENAEVMEFKKLLKKVVDFLEMTDEEVQEVMAQFYTDLNIDGRFISLGQNRWGLREWYPVDSIDEELTHDNAIEEIQPKVDKDGFDDYENIQEKEFAEEDVNQVKSDEDNDDIEYGDRVKVDDHGVMVDEDDEEDLGEFKEDIDDDEELENLSVVGEDELDEFEADEETEE